jgi:hypothetical protein
MVRKNASAQTQVTPDDFVIRAIETLRPGKTAIHTVYSDFNLLFREYFGRKEDPVETVQRMFGERKISLRPTKGGVMIAKPGVLKPFTPKEAVVKEGLKKMGIKK